MTATAARHLLPPVPVPASQPVPRGAFNPADSGLGVLVPVLGAHPQVGTSGIALALADAAATAGLRVLLVDCADPARSGLAGVAGVEGPSVQVAHGKAPVRIASRNLANGTVSTRRLVGTGSPLPVSAVPLPPSWAAADQGEFDVTIVDVGWDVWPLMASGSPLGPLTWCTGTPTATFPVLVLRPTAPSVLLAEGVLTRYAFGTQRLGLAGLHTVVAVCGEAWPQQVSAVMGLHLRRAADRALFVPAAADVSMTGWSTAPAPTASVRVASALLHGLGGKLAESVRPPQPSRRGWRRGQS